MGFFDNVGKSISNVGQSTVKMTKDFAEVSKMNAEIAEQEKKENAAYYQMGKLYFSKHQHDAEDEFVAQINMVIDAENKIKECRHQISVVKGVVVCPGCGAENPIGSSFCVSCGKAIPKDASPLDETKMLCPNCGATISKGVRFCTSCGKPVEISSVTLSEASPKVMQLNENAAQPYAGIPMPGIPMPAAEGIDQVHNAEAQDYDHMQNAVAQDYDHMQNADDSDYDHVQNAEPAGNADQGSVKCPQCGADLESDAVFCVNCGAKVR